MLFVFFALKTISLSHSYYSFSNLFLLSFYVFIFKFYYKFTKKKFSTFFQIRTAFMFVCFISSILYDYLPLLIYNHCFLLFLLSFESKILFHSFFYRFLFLLFSKYFIIKSIVFFLGLSLYSI